MKVIVMAIGGFGVTQLSGVTSIAYDAATKIYTITHGGGTATYSADSYRVNILW